MNTHITDHVGDAREKHLFINSKHIFNFKMLFQMKHENASNVGFVFHMINVYEE